MSFRFLGLKTNKSWCLILVDGAARVKHFAKNLPQILRNTIAVFGSEVEFAFAFCRYGPNGPNIADGRGPGPNRAVRKARPRRLNS